MYLIDNQCNKRCTIFKSNNNTINMSELNQI
jgi:hypothetical protein